METSLQVLQYVGLPRWVFTLHGYHVSHKLVGGVDHPVGGGWSLQMGGYSKA